MMLTPTARIYQLDFQQGDSVKTADGEILYVHGVDEAVQCYGTSLTPDGPVTLTPVMELFGATLHERTKTVEELIGQ